LFNTQIERTQNDTISMNEWQQVITGVEPNGHAERPIMLHI